jgi:hypothetical protein
MPDWIDKVEENDKTQAEKRARQEELRLHRAKVITAKAPEWWDAVIERLQADSSKLREKFPNDTSRQCTIAKSGNDWELQGCKLPWKILNMQLNVAGQCVDIMESERESRDKVRQVERTQIKITVNSDEELEFRYQSSAHVVPALLAQALIRYVCGGRAFDAP